MSQKRFIYAGPNSAVTLKVQDAQGVMVDREVMLWNGSTVELPSDHAFTDVLLKQRLLTPEQSTASDSTTARSKSKAA